MASQDPSKHRGKKSKAASKSNAAIRFQWEILESLGIPPSEIELFAKPEHWLQYFPPIAKEDIR